MSDFSFMFIFTLHYHPQTRLSKAVAAPLPPLPPWLLAAEVAAVAFEIVAAAVVAVQAMMLPAEGARQRQELQHLPRWRRQRRHVRRRRQRRHVQRRRRGRPIRLQRRLLLRSFG